MNNDRDESTYGCTSDLDNITYFFNKNPTKLLTDDFISGETMLSISLHAFTSDGLIDVDQALVPGASSLTVFHDDLHERRRLRRNGVKEILVVRVTSLDGSIAPSQSEAQLVNDFFQDENNLAKRFDDCSNGQLKFTPAQGTNVNNGILTVKTAVNLNQMDWQTCGNVATAAAGLITRDHILIVCPNEVDFNGAAAWGSTGGVITWYRSQFASFPVIQVHEIGHNLGHSHSTADPTCHMGNRGSWTDVGTKFCFNGAKTFVNGWYSEYHHTMDPLTETFYGKMYGINTVRDRSIPSDGKVVIRLTNDNEWPWYLIFQRQIGANAGIPQDGDKVVITVQEKETRSKSSWKKALGEFESEPFQWAGESLEIRVCRINLGESSAEVMIGKQGQVVCPVNYKPTAPPATLQDPIRCQDIPSKFQWSASKKENCKFVGAKNTASRCKRAAEFCPLTCAPHTGTNCDAFDRANKFNVAGQKLTCPQAASKPNFCKKNKVRSFCPIACGIV